MDIRQLRYFLAIAEEGQITSAAKKLRMAQPPLSHQLKLLEEELGVQLVERGPRSIRLTDAGAVLRNKARQIVELTDSTAREISDLAKGLGGTLSIGTVSSSGATLLTEKLVQFHRSHTGVKFEIHEGNTFMIIDLLNKGIVEVGIVRTPFNEASLECRYAEPEPMIAVMTPQFDWLGASVGGDSAITVEDLKNKPLIIYRRFEQLIQEACLQHGFEPDFTCTNDDARTTLLWANAGFGIGIIPRSALDLAANSNLLYRTIQSDALRTQVAAICMKDRYKSSLAAQFIDIFAPRAIAKKPSGPH